ncbi:MAG: DUF6152 family protein [Pseudomonadota bacterium]
MPGIELTATGRARRRDPDFHLGMGVLAALLLVWCDSVLSHHSFASIYDQSRSVTVQAVVREFRFVHPHPILVVGVVVDGAKQSWRAEMDNRYELEEIGITVQTFRPGDRVVLTGSPGRAQPDTLYLWKLTRPSDGLHYEQVGSTPSLRTPGSR